MLRCGIPSLRSLSSAQPKLQKSSELKVLLTSCGSFQQYWKPISASHETFSAVQCLVFSRNITGKEEKESWTSRRELYISFLEPFHSSVSYSHLDFDSDRSNVTMLPCTTCPFSTPHSGDGLPSQCPRHAGFFGWPRKQGHGINASSLDHTGFYRKNLITCLF